MVLIYLRIRANVPTILLGETGCGKTYLIENLIYFLEGRYKLIKLNIHSGFTYHDISEFLRNNNLFSPKLLNKEEKGKDQKNKDTKKKQIE